jgi:predicted  nucleic acid-binding Zn-ribbon protein
MGLGDYEKSLVNQGRMNKRAKASNSSKNRQSSSDTRNRVRILEQNFVKLQKDIDDINSRIKKIKRVTTDSKGRTIILT